MINEFERVVINKTVAYVCESLEGDIHEVIDRFLKKLPEAIRKSFKESTLVYTQNGKWYSASMRYYFHFGELRPIELGRSTRAGAIQEATTDSEGKSVFL